MYQLSFNELSIQSFLNIHWQKKPLLIKAAFKEFHDPISPEELAGLAQENEIESRIITNHNNNWRLHHGPFEEFSELTPEHSTLLVQAVDHWHPEAAELLSPFRFIPNWRIDDLMISYSTPGGGVGPHLDQYDVFIIQGQGKRHWRVGLAAEHLNEFVRDGAIKQVDEFDAVIDAVLEPGDMLYIPPGCPHEGYAVENALNYSVGFRAPDQKDMLSSFADYLIDNELGNHRYSDPKLKQSLSPGLIESTEIENARSLVQNCLQNDENFIRWFGTAVTQPKHELDIVSLETPLTIEQLKTELLHTDSDVFRLGGVRCSYTLIENTLLLFVNGELFELSANQIKNVKLLTDHEIISAPKINSSLNCLEFAEVFANLINAGYWYLD